jgi:hypothetical protein
VMESTSQGGTGETLAQGTAIKHGTGSQLQSIQALCHREKGECLCDCMCVIVCVCVILCVCDCVCVIVSVWFYV